MKHITAMILTGFVVSLCISCHDTQPGVRVIKHMAQTGWAGSAGAYADQVPNSAILKEDGGDTGTTVYYCLRVGLYDSTDVADKELETAREKYFQQDMYKDWVLDIGGDSVAPLFSQPIPRKQQKLTEQVLVYEIPKGVHPSQLIYKDPYKLLGHRQTMLLHDTEQNKN
jgi:hypothetical protein